MKMTERDKKAVARKKDFVKPTFNELLADENSTELERRIAFQREWYACCRKIESKGG